MAKVRLDVNSQPKNFVYEPETPVLHRNAITQVDASDPASAADGIPCDGFQYCDFDIQLTLGGTTPVLEVAPIFYDATADLWFKGESSFFSETGKYRLRSEVRGAIIFLKAIELTGTSPTMTLSAWAVLS